MGCLAEAGTHVGGEGGIHALELLGAGDADFHKVGTSPLVALTNMYLCPRQAADSLGPRDGGQGS